MYNTRWDERLFLGTGTIELAEDIRNPPYPSQYQNVI